MPESRNQPGRVTFIILMLALGIGGFLLFSALSGRQVDANLHYAYRSLALNIVLVAAALAAGLIPGLFLSPSREEQFGPAILAVSYALAGFGLWRGLNAFSQSVNILAQIGNICLVGAIAWALSHLAVYAQRREIGGLFSGIFNWLVNSRSLFLLIVLAAAVYAFIIRPAFMGTSAYSVLLEWIIIIVAGVIILAITRLRIGSNFTDKMAAPIPEWRRHRQHREPKVDPEYTQLRFLNHRFIEYNDSTMLVHFLISLLVQNGVKENDIAKVMSPLIGYRGHAKPESSRQGRTERENLLKTTITGMQSIVQPARYTRYAVQAAKASDALTGGEEPETLSGLINDFCREGDHSRLMVRLSQMLVRCGTRSEDIEEMLLPLVNYSGSSQNGRHERERLWRDIVSRAAFYAPKLSLKE